MSYFIFQINVVFNFGILQQRHHTSYEMTLNGLRGSACYGKKYGKKYMKISTKQCR